MTAARHLELECLGLLQRCGRKLVLSGCGSLRFKGQCKGFRFESFSVSRPSRVQI